MRQVTSRTRTSTPQDGPQRRLLRGYLHKTSNSLCGIKGYASLIAGEEAPVADAARWAQRIIREVERLERIFRSVGDLTAPAAPQDGACDLGQAVAGAVARAAAARPEVEIATAALPAAELLLPAADLRLVLGELLANAAEGRDGERGARRVDVTAATGPDGRVALTVAADGPGMEPELVGQAADPFVTTKEGRPGVGLTRVETLLDMYGLAWHLGSEPGRGTSVTLEVAAAAARIPAGT